MKKIYTVIFAIVTFLFSLNTTAFADNEFSTSYDVHYEIAKDGLATSTQNITLRNLTSKYYASNFTLTIGSTTLTEVSASSNNKPLVVEVNPEDKKTSLNVKLDEQIAGLGKTQTFILKFKSKDFSQSIGKTWEVNLPKLPSSGNIESYNLTLSVPVSFGEPTSIAPIPKTESQSGDRLLMTFTKEQLENSGVSVNFGTDQTYTFSLDYDLENSSLFPILTNITLPPDTPYQEVLLNSLNPAPVNVTTDPDGNILAWYRMERRSKQTISATGMIKLYIRPKYKTGQTITEEQKKELTKKDVYWESDNTLIKTALSEIFKNGQPTSNQDSAKLIYRYVVDNLKYNTNRIKSENVDRLGAVTALNNPESSICMEFTDLFIALSRAAGIPARELDGFAYTQNKELRPSALSNNLLHAWPEYYDDKLGWLMVDPTWENTSGGVDYFNKFDLNHIVLAVKGRSSRTPYITDKVKVEVSQTDIIPNPQLVVNVDTPDAIWSGFPNEFTVRVHNQGQSIHPPTSLSISSNRTEVIGASFITLGAIPPYGYTDYKFKVRTPNVWDTFYDDIEIKVAGLQYRKSLEIKPFLYFHPFPYVLLVLVVGVVTVYISVLYHHVSKVKRLKSVKTHK